jgi:hypothetical protein
VTDPTDHAYYRSVNAVTSATEPHLDPANWQYRSNYCYQYIIDWYTNMMRPILEIGPNYGGDGHAIPGAVYDYRGGKYYAHRLDQPNCQDLSGPCASQYIGAPNPGSTLMPAARHYDHHASWRNNGSQDLQPVFEPTALVPSWGGLSIPDACDGGSGIGGYCQAGFNEEIAISTDGLGTLYRFGHNYNTCSNAGFQTQNSIGVVSQDGKMLAYGSDFMDTRGDLNGSATCSNPVRAQYQPTANGCVALNDYVLPINNNSSNDIFKVTSLGSAAQGSCAAGQVQEASTLPNWNSSCTNAGNICTDANGIQFTNQGPNSCRGEIGLMDLLSAH